MTKLVLRTDTIQLRDADKAFIRALDERTAYFVKGYYFAPAFKSKHWDGKVHLLKFSKTRGYTIPIGLLDDAKEILDEEGIEYEVTDTRVHPDGIDIPWDGDKEPRDYQEEAAQELLAAGGSGILKMPIRSGKTTTAAYYMHLLGQKTIFIVPSKHLLHQTRKDLARCFGMDVEDIGVIGDGEWQIEEITVASIQTLHARRKKKDQEFIDMCYAFGLVVFDECHHLTSEEWRDTMMAVKARYRVGLSATALIDRESEMEKGVIWLKAACGPIRFEADMSALVEAGFISRPTFHLYKIKKPSRYQKHPWSADLHDNLIFNNEHRNNLIAKLADYHAEQGRRVLVVTKRLAQLGYLMDRFRQPAEGITGRMPTGDRNNIIDMYKSKHIMILAGTVFKEGVDLPEIEVLINAEGGADPKATVQRLRNLTPMEGKEAIVIDFMDLTHKQFAKHSQERLSEYTKEKAFKFIVKEHP